VIRRSILAGLLAFALLSGLAPSHDARAQAGDRLFPETGFTVPARFMSYWNSHGGLPVFGYPITAARQENGYLVQYFERNRFEYHPENAGTPYEVLLGLLGNMITAGQVFAKSPVFPSNPTNAYFDATGHSLGGAFLQYWRAHGGLAVFGYPISEELQERNAADGKTYTVQYFERNRFEMHPENRAPYDVLLGLLGRDYLTNVGPPAQPSAAGPFPGWSKDPPAGYPAAPPGPFPVATHADLGVIVHMYYQDHRRVLDRVQELASTWIKQQVQWKDIEGSPGAYAWGELDSIVADTAARKLHIMLSVAKAPDWATGGSGGFPSNSASFGDFMRAMAAHYRGQVQAYEIWNEQNLFVESHDLAPARYAELLRAGYLGTKAGDPGAIVVSGALTPTGIYDPKVAAEDTWYLDQLYQWNNGELRQYYDVLGSHPYGYNNPPATMWPDNPSHATAFTTHGQFYFRRVEQQRQVMEKFGEAGKQVWLTEFGWCSDARPDGYAECAETTPAQQASYTLWAITRARALYPWMGVMFVWNLNFSTFQEWYTGPSHFSLLNADWSARPVFDALKARPRP
jgi:polysaccharide biosynthesis protein PslG